MQISRSNVEPPSLEELKDLEKLRKVIERATADNLLSKEEIETIKVVIRADGKITPEELDLCQRLIWDKIKRGELSYDWTEFS